MGSIGASTTRNTRGERLSRATIQPCRRQRRGPADAAPLHRGPRPCWPRSSWPCSTAPSPMWRWPTIATTLHVTPAASVWVVTGYQMALVVSLLPCAALGESFGYRRIFTGGVVGVHGGLRPLRPLAGTAHAGGGPLPPGSRRRRHHVAYRGLAALHLSASDARHRNRTERARRGACLGHGTDARRAAILSLARWPLALRGQYPDRDRRALRAAPAPAPDSGPSSGRSISSAWPSTPGFFAPLVVGVDLTDQPGPALGAACCSPPRP